MEKKITIRDIAKQAGVSIATVSYVINNRSDQRISDETKKKVLQVINLLNYKPNSSAKSLATNKTWNVALYMKSETSICKRYEQSLMMEALAATLKQHNYHLLFQCSSDIENLNYADAILCYDVPIDYFLQIGDQNYIPLIAIDTLVNIPWFFQVCTDYVRIRDCAMEHFQGKPFFYLGLEPNNDNVETSIRNTFEEVRFFHDYSDISYSPEEYLVYSSPSLRPLLEANPNALYIPVNIQEKSSKVYDCMELALERVPDMEHHLYV